MPKKPFLITILGPTATGKTDLAIELAKELDTVILSADSRQFYKEMAIGTDKPKPEQRDEAPHYFIDSHSIHEELSASDFADEALKLLKEIYKTKEVAILAGGSGLYIRALLESFDEIPAVPESIRKELNNTFEKKGLEPLLKELKEKNPEAYQAIDIQNPKRVIRALEVFRGTGKSITAFWNSKQNKVDPPFQVLKVGLYLPREELYRKIEERCDQMLENGLLEEAKSLYPYKHLNPLNTVGYKEFFDYLDGNVDYKEAVRRFKVNTRRFAKRQLTWFRREPDIHWFLPSEKDKIKELVFSNVCPS